VTVAVGAFPERGGDVLASSGTLHAGGSGFNVMSAASRLGVTSIYGGMHGTGPFGDLARTAMNHEGIELVQQPDADEDTGWDIAITDASAERTFITVVGAESRLTAERIALVTIQPGDAVYVSGYGLLAEPNRTTILDWLKRAPAGVVVVTDPGPLVADIPDRTRGDILAHTTWWSANEREATTMTGEHDPMVAAFHIAQSGCGVVVRLGASGCVVAEPGKDAQLVPGVAVDALDTNGAGDAHVGAFIASLLDGLDPLASAGRANAAAAFSVTRAGPATAPTARELEQFLERGR
jgi:sugar/nucleoside kinase (ribokinase family)